MCVHVAIVHVGGTPEPEHLSMCVANVPQSPSGPDTYLIHSHPNKLRSPDNR